MLIEWFVFFLFHFSSQHLVLPFELYYLHQHSNASQISKGKLKVSSQVCIFWCKLFKSKCGSTVQFYFFSFYWCWSSSLKLRVGKLFRDVLTCWLWWLPSNHIHQDRYSNWQRYFQIDRSLDFFLLDYLLWWILVFSFLTACLVKLQKFN